MLSFRELIYGDDDITIVRGGIIPFAKIGKNHYKLLLGVKRTNNFYSDFGGGIKRHETFVTGTQREVNEETAGFFGFDVLNLLLNDECIMLDYQTKCSVRPTFYVEMLVPVLYDPEIPSRFGNRSEEHSQLVWVDVKARESTTFVAEKLAFTDILARKIDGSIKPLIPSIMKALERL